MHIHFITMIYLHIYTETTYNCIIYIEFSIYLMNDNAQLRIPGLNQLASHFPIDTQSRKSEEIILTDGHPRGLHMKSARPWIDTPLLCSSTCLSFASPRRHLFSPGKSAIFSTSGERKEPRPFGARTRGKPAKRPKRETICRIFHHSAMTPISRMTRSPHPLLLTL